MTVSNSARVSFHPFIDPFASNCKPNGRAQWNTAVKHLVYLLSRSSQGNVYLVKLIASIRTNKKGKSNLPTWQTKRFFFCIRLWSVLQGKTTLPRCALRCMYLNHCSPQASKKCWDWLQKGWNKMFSCQTKWREMSTFSWIGGKFRFWKTLSWSWRASVFPYCGLLESFVCYTALQHCVEAVLKVFRENINAKS